LRFFHNIKVDNPAKLSKCDLARLTVRIFLPRGACDVCRKQQARPLTRVDLSIPEAVFARLAILQQSAESRQDTIDALHNIQGMEDKERDLLADVARQLIEQNNTKAVVVDPQYCGQVPLVGYHVVRLGNFNQVICERAHRPTGLAWAPLPMAAPTMEGGAS
jgi:hypothetical protein